MESKPNNSKHPSLYALQVPNPLVTSRASLNDVNAINPKKGERKLAPLTVNEFKLLSLVIYLVRSGPVDTQYYSIRYDDVITKGSLKGGNRKKVIDTLRSNLHLRFLTIDKKYAPFYFPNYTPEEDPSFSPFMTFLPERDSFKVELHPVYKSIIKGKEFGYTKADLETIFTLKTTSSNYFYLEVRQRQSMSKRWTMTLDEFRYKLYLEKKYDTWNDLEKRVLKKIQKEYKGKWTEFEYEPIKVDKGRVTGITFICTKGPQDEKDLPAGYDFKWEKKLQDYGVYDHLVVKIRNLVKAGEPHKLGFPWDEYFVIYSIEAFRDAMVQKMKRPTKSKEVRSPGAFLYEALISGWYVEEVAEKRAHGQLRIDGFTVIDHSKQLASAVTEIEIIEEIETDHTETWKNLWEDIKKDPRNTFKSFEEFIAAQKTLALVDGKVVSKQKLAK